MADNLTGAQAEKVRSLEPITSGKMQKVQDTTIKKDYILTTVSSVGDETKYTIQMTVPASVKYYVGRQDWVHLSQYSGKNSILMDSLHEIYGATWDDETAYAIYNALVFSWAPESKGDGPDKNYRIIRHDLILRTAYVYLAGSQVGNEVKVFIHNNKVYPILGILKAIYDKEINTTDVFNTTKADRYFDIYISHGGDANKWIPAPNDGNTRAAKYTPNKGAATIRIKRAMDACTKLLTRASIKVSLLDQATIMQYLPFTPSIKVDLS